MAVELAPAYDLTLSSEGCNGEHATSVNGTGHPRLYDFIAVGAKIKLTEDRCREIIEEVSSACSELTRYHPERMISADIAAPAMRRRCGVGLGLR